MKLLLTIIAGASLITALMWRPNQEYVFFEVCSYRTSALNSTGIGHAFGQLTAGDVTYYPIWPGEVVAMSVRARTAASGEIQIVPRINDADATDTLFVVDAATEGVKDSMRVAFSAGDEITFNTIDASAGNTFDDSRLCAVLRVRLSDIKYDR